MNIIKPATPLLFAAVMLTNHVHANEAFPRLEGPWLGQTPPGLTAQLFAPDIISINGRYEFGVSFSPDLTEVYFTAFEEQENVDSSPRIMYSKIENAQWTQPQAANFTGGRMSYELVPHVSLNDNRIYFTARSDDPKASGIWYVTRSKGGWSEAKRFDSAINTGKFSDFNQSANGDTVFSNMSERKMYTAENKNGTLTTPKAIDIEFGFHGFISPANDYLLVNSRHRGDKSRKDNDLYVYFKEQDGTWSSPINLGEGVNTPYSETVPRITPDGKYLFFGRYNEPGDVSNIYWVSTEVITRLKETYFAGKSTKQI